MTTQEGRTDNRVSIMAYKVMPMQTRRLHAFFRHAEARRRWNFRPDSTWHDVDHSANDASLDHTHRAGR